MWFWLFTTAFVTGFTLWLLTPSGWFVFAMIAGVIGMYIEMWIKS